MTRLYTIGGFGEKLGNDVSSLTFQPLLDRAARVTRIEITNPSAADDWDISVQGQYIMRPSVNINGNQQWLGNADTNYPKNRNFFDFCREYLGIDPTIPVPQGQTLTVASVGGATADVTIRFVEYTPMEVLPGELNGQSASHYVMPFAFVPKTNVTHTSGSNEDDFASQKAPLWLPNLFGAIQIPAQYQITVLALFLEGAGRNTFSGSADHLSTTEHLGLDYQGQRMWTRDALKGPVNLGKDAATGSANTVYGFEHDTFPPFQETFVPQRNVLDPPLVLKPGSQAHFWFGTVGDSTGGADYSGALQGAILDVQWTGMVPQ